jgi:hypothetical protein
MEEEKPSKNFKALLPQPCIEKLETILCFQKPCSLKKLSLGSLKKFNLAKLAFCPKA